MCVAFGVIELFRLHRPEEGHQTHAAQKQRHRDQECKNLHLRQPPDHFKRMAFRDTVIDDSDIASAAARGVAIPTSAKGTATTL